MSNVIAIIESDEALEEREVMPAEIVLEGQPDADSWVCDEFPASGVAKAGIWVGDPGKIDIPAYPTDEVFTVLSGRVEVTNSDGSVLAFGPGDSGLLRKGWKGVWHTVEQVRKCYVSIGEQ